MNILFERFATRLMEAQISPDLVVEDQHHITLGTHNQVTMRPDIVLRRGGRALIGIDCKYKRLDSGKYENHDQYQVLANCTALNVTRGMLVYPRHEHALDEEIRVRNSDVRIRQISIDLGGDQAAFAGACKVFVARVTTWSFDEPTPPAGAYTS